MKAFRLYNGSIIEFEVDVDKNGNPLLPPNTTIDPKPAVMPGHYLTISGNTWKQVPIPVHVPSFEERRNKKLDDLKSIKEAYLNQPVEYNGRKFDADSFARDNLTQAIVVYRETNYLPPYWVDYDNQQYTISSVDDLKGILSAVQTAYSNRFYELDNVRQALLSATTEADLDAITIPTLDLGTV
jgi:hypothetical protein